jgi:hypothetical protein
MENRSGADPNLIALAQTARERQQLGESFTETLLTLAAQHGVSEAALDAAQFHQPLGAAAVVHALSIDECKGPRLNAIARQVASDRILVMTSELETSSGPMHLPMADFKLPAHKANHPAAVAAATRLGNGYLLVSGSSYHFYGSTVIGWNEFRDWLLRAQLLSRYIDTRWVTHQLLERRCALRISAGGASGEVPVFLQEVTQSSAMSSRPF